jgi:hypothetical protein
MNMNDTEIKIIKALSILTNEVAKNNTKLKKLQIVVGILLIAVVCLTIIITIN